VRGNGTKVVLGRAERDALCNTKQRRRQRRVP
jgi:hypothetical protein